MQQEQAQEARRAYIEGQMQSCGYLGHLHRLGDKRCACGYMEAFRQDPEDVNATMLNYGYIAADALCAEREHRGVNGGVSWREGLCSCDLDVRKVISTIGRAIDSLMLAEARTPSDDDQPSAV
jgi:hypothetical protein